MVSFNAEGKNYEDLECGSCAGVKPEMQVILNTRAGDGRMRVIPNLTTKLRVWPAQCGWLDEYSEGSSLGWKK